MGIVKTLFGNNRTVPEENDFPWADEVTTQLSDLIDGVDNTAARDGSSNVLEASRTVSGTLAAAATLTPTARVHRVSGSGGAVTLDSTTPVAAGFKDGQKLTITGGDDTNTVTVPASGTCSRINGAAILGNGESLYLVWDATDSKWDELGRSN